MDKTSELFNLESFSVQPKPSESWCPDDWETPNEVAKFMTSLVSKHDRTILEPSAGRGQIAKHLPNGTTCIEVNPKRHEVGAVPTQNWLCTDFLAYAKKKEAISPDLIIGNPPFSLGMEFLLAAAQLLAPGGRVLFLFPSDFFQAQSRAKLLIQTGLVVSKQWAIAGRVAFLKEGATCKNRQCYDSVFELKRKGSCKEAVEIVDPYSRLNKG